MKLLAFLLFASSLFAQPDSLKLESDSVYPKRFIAAHGQRAIIEGYSSEGLEGWAYPYQLFRDYQLSLRRQGDASATASIPLLRRIQVTPSSITRIYAGPDFVVRETLFVPLDRAALLVTYAVESPAPLDIIVRLTPVMDLMWPASTGGQVAQWSENLNGFLLHENDGVRALLSSPQMIAHDSQWNSTQDLADGTLSFTLQASSQKPATLAVTFAPNPSEDLAAASHALLADAPQLEQVAQEHYRSLLNSSVQIETPEPALNAALAWATVALDQSWVCNTDLGCALVAGYGPSRRARRPQYQWFFAGDGLIGTEAMLNLGDQERACQELEFIFKYQDPASGMIWHELTQSAHHLEWADKFPYMFVHVDLTFQFLSEMQNYERMTGDKEFLRRHWKQVQAAYRYCESTIDSTTHLPGIPASKSGSNEQDKLEDELSLSSAWIEAANAYSEMAVLMNDSEAATRARQAVAVASQATLPRYWDGSKNFFTSGHTHDGRPAEGRSLAASDATLLALLTPAQRNALLDQLASSDFQMDWGSRSLAPGPAFTPASYGNGSISPLSTSSAAETFWRSGRSWSAEALWRALFSGQSLDSLGHLHELYSGSYYREQEESVPEQMWSTASLLSATFEGLLGLREDAVHNSLHFSPSLPAAWDFLRIRNVKLGQRTLRFELRNNSHGHDLSFENSGEPFTLDYRPLLPLGAKMSTVKLQGKSIAFTQSSDETNARYETRPTITATIPHGSSRLALEYSGGVSLLVPIPNLQVGDMSHTYKLISAEHEGHKITFRLDVPGDRSSVLWLRTAERLIHSSGARLQPASTASTWQLIIEPATASSSSYRRAEVSVEVAPKSQEDGLPKEEVDR